MSSRTHNVGAHLCLSGAVAGVVLPCFAPPVPAAIVAVTVVAVGVVMFFAGREE